MPPPATSDDTPEPTVPAPPPGAPAIDGFLDALAHHLELTPDQTRALRPAAEKVLAAWPDFAGRIGPKTPELKARYEQWKRKHKTPSGSR